jgi:hypothetical protein
MRRRAGHLAVWKNGGRADHGIAARVSRQISGKSHDISARQNLHARPILCRSRHRATTDHAGISARR